MPGLPLRQIHLDFHTTEKIVPIADAFEPEVFARTLADASVNSVTCFSKCHHGLIYHDTKFEARHPGLKRNLLAEQIEACHRVGIHVPIYISAGLDMFQSTRHPEWIELDDQNRLNGASPLQAGWQKLCFNSPYMDYLYAQTHEVLTTLPVDGLFFDIIHQGACCCRFCMKSMIEAGMNPESRENRLHFAAAALRHFRRHMTNLIRAHNADCTIFYNSGHVGPDVRATLDSYTHLELESLPSGGWGYDHFPATVRFARTLGVETLGMTGKFLKSWADFGGIKTQPALEYECFTALAEGAGCSVGDQLHPRGALDPATYELVGAVYRSVAEKEPWCVGARPVTEIGVFTPEALGQQDGSVDTALAGAYHMLISGHHQFDVVDEDSDWSRYRVIILPDKITLDDELTAKADRYVKSGGSVILSHRSGMDRETQSHFMLADTPVRYLAEGRHCPDYVEAERVLAAGVPPSQHVMYERGLEVEALDGAQTLAEVWWPYFDRTWEHFCSHNQTPPDRASGVPAVVRRERIIYFSHPIFGMFKRHGSHVYKRLVQNALNLLLPDPLVTTNAPSTAHVTLLRQETEKRYVAHVLHYIPENRYTSLHTVEDVIPLRDVELSLRVPAPKRVSLVPSGQELPFVMREGRVRITIPEVRGHAMVALED
ncbi:MAG: beta-galactosidase trimerization domain-containing protein [Candidatus Hydrogenedentes bacterium]|nr:beta-galactosidase trimerization domain-containing protein [Candidatus Hydrogenedentota bacterium]